MYMDGFKQCQNVKVDDLSGMCIARDIWVFIEADELNHDKMPKFVPNLRTLLFKLNGQTESHRNEQLQAP